MVGVCVCANNVWLHNSAAISPKVNLFITTIF
jgi:hypothetical protein